MTRIRTIAVAALLASGVAFAAPIHAQEGVYYPKPKFSETRETIARVLPDASEVVRDRFADHINEVTGQAAGGQPQFAVLAVGTDKETFLLSATTEGGLDTKYRAQAAVARMTAWARTAPILIEAGLQNDFDIFDYLHLLGYRRLIISDGDTFAHEFVIAEQ